MSLYDYKRLSVSASVNDKKSQDEVIRALIDADYLFDRLLENPGTYKAEGDSLTIRSYYDDEVVTLGFF